MKSLTISVRQAVDSQTIASASTYTIPAGRRIRWFTASQSSLDLQASYDGGTTWKTLYKSGDSNQIIRCSNSANATEVNLLSDGSNLRLLNNYAGNNITRIGYEVWS